MRNMTSGNIISIAFIGLLSSLLGACASGDAATGPDAEGYDLSRYQKVLIEPVTVSFDESWRPVESGSHMSASATEVDRTRREIAALFDAALRAELTQDQAVQIVDQEGPGVLHITPVLKDVYLNAPLERDARSTDIYTRSIGHATVETVFRDSESGDVLLILDDHLRGRDLNLVRTATPTLNKVELSRIFRNWAEVVRREIFGGS